jgi:hypothetical protein
MKWKEQTFTYKHFDDFFKKRMFPQLNNICDPRDVLYPSLPFWQILVMCTPTLNLQISQETPLD